jgi:hypothetical protein
MKKILIYGIFCFTFLGFDACKKQETIDPIQELNNTTWTGFFAYEPIKEYQLPIPSSNKVAEQPFGIDFLADGKFQFYEASSGVSGGTWKLVGETITITQENKNVITMTYSNGKLSFVKLVGAPYPWAAFGLEKFDSKTTENLEGSTWQNINPTKAGLDAISKEGFSFSSVNTIPQVYYHKAGYYLKASIRSNIIWWNNFICILRNDGKMYVANTTGTSFVTLNVLTRK